MIRNPATKRASWIDVSGEPAPLDDVERGAFEAFDLVYRTLCAVLYNYVPLSGHPGGSISSGRIAAAIAFDALDYDLSDPERADADVLSYAAGHKALGLYALWALRNEVARIGAPELLPEDPAAQLRLEDLLGFRRNPTMRTPLVERFGSKPLDGHPTPATPFIRIATGASGVGVASSLGLAFGAIDAWGSDAPRIHVLEGEGGLTPGRVAEALAAAGTASLSNAVLHVDWNQASIDSNAVCREGATPGDYVQWSPMELAYLHDWNVVYVPDGHDFQQIVAAQRLAAGFENSQPTAIVYRTVKGWNYGIEGKASHGAGHKLCAEGFYSAIAALERVAGKGLPRCEPPPPCVPDATGAKIEECFWQALQVIRGALLCELDSVRHLAERLRAARARLDRRARRLRDGVPRLETVYEAAGAARETPPELALAPGASTTLRGELGRALGWYNRASGGALLGAAADLLHSTSIASLADGFPSGFFHARTNPGSRLLSTGGICEDAMCGLLSGISAYGRHLGVGSSYGAFIAPLGHIAARLHAIGLAARREVTGREYDPFLLVCAHAGLKTGEDGPTHADPQCLQVLQDNFPPGAMITLTPWDPQELFPLLTEALVRRPAVIAPFVTRPNEKVLDRAALGLPPASAARQGLYRLRTPKGTGDGTVVLQGSAVTYAFLQDALPRLDAEGLDLHVYYVASSELFGLLPEAERERIYPEERAREAIGITDFTLATMDRWVTSRRGRAATLHPFREGHFLGSGPGARVLLEAGLDGASQFRAIVDHVRGPIV